MTLNYDSTALVCQYPGVRFPTGGFAQGRAGDCSTVVSWYSSVIYMQQEVGQMGEIRLLRELEEDLEEKQLQRAIEADLTALEDNLQYVASEVVIGTGRIDTLAVDEDGRPTFIEYKRAGKFDKNALVQL